LDTPKPKNKERNKKEIRWIAAVDSPNGKEK
jgi:hypothetical protein